MRVYFAGSIRGGRDDAAVYQSLIAYISQLAEVLTEHVGDGGLTNHGEDALPDDEIYARDMGWIDECDAVIAEVSTPSLGVGYEIGAAEAMGKPVLCLFDEGRAGRRLSAMVSGNQRIRLIRYQGLDEVRRAIREFISEVG